MRVKKILVTLIIIMCGIIFVNTNVCAKSIETSGVDIKSNVMNQWDDVGSIIVSTIKIIGMIVSVGSLMIIGIRYMTSSVEEKAMQKESMILYCIGAALLFAIVNIVSAIYEWTSTL